jgi:hypothetical protein
MNKMNAKEVKKIIQQLKSERSLWESHWQDIADYIFIRKNDVLNRTTPGEKKAFRLLDNTGMYSNEMLAGALHGMLTNPDLTWFEFSTGNVELDREDRVRKWLQESSRALHFIFNNSNFQTEVHELYLDLCSFGTGCMLVEEDKKDIVRFKTKFIRDYYIAENYYGKVDQIYYEYKATAKDIIDAFGIESAPREVKEAQEKSLDKKFICVHAVYPASMKNPGKDLDHFISQYFILDTETEISSGKFNQFPYVVPRWTKAAGEIYGRSPGMNALPEMKVLNKMNETMLIGAQKKVDPPIQMPDDGYILPIVTVPGGINYYRSGTQEFIKPVFADTNIDFGYQAMEDRRKRVRDAYYIDHLRLQQGGPMMTATEVLQRTEEAMRLLGPMLGRQQSEFLRPLVDRAYAIADNRGLIPPPPEELAGMNITVKYSSLIAKSQKINEAQSILRVVSAITPFIQMNPGVMDNFDGDKVARVLVNTYGAPQEMLVDSDVVAASRQQRAEQAMQVKLAQAQAQQGVDSLNTAKAMKTVSEIGVVGG